MQLVFIAGFTVENRTGATIYVTPIGTVGPQGHRHPLPLAVWKKPWVPASKLGRFPVRSGETITLYYDWDDINFSELVVEADDGEMRQLVVNPEPTANQYTVPRVTDFVIADLGHLGAVDQRVRLAHAAAQRPVQWWPILAVTTAPAVTFVLLRRRYRRLKATMATRHAEPSAAPDPTRE